MLPHPCSSEVYEARMKAAISQVKGRDITHMAFGDLYLEDVVVHHSFCKFARS